ncbi:TnsA endonuclease N-terminal domain-containing protein [Crenobacter cavernae]|uniref:Heteromeric transposase endonuclease subunit TnsA n=1 Tax=Crenobacter cavernae TaxID=2290923 RepID=A0A345Y3A6_9NEIS|nr:TnsA endonuclease N-terminal domain-containing protein [Crenobacter cavernae]AXK38408.1 heteromeric transposase endonuclease subunit TnsA [Crenobacter cavernae]
MRLKDAWVLNVGTPESVRRIPINAISLTGELLGKEFESSLERDLIIVMAWNNELDWFQVQPVKIPFQGQDGRRHTYTPDLLASFVSDAATGVPVRKPVLCEVKYRDELARNWKTLKPKFKAARAYARERGWEFRLFTESRIRTVLLQNIQFLWPYRFAPEHHGHRARLVRMLDDMEETSIGGLLEACYLAENRAGRGEGLWTLWCLIAKQSVLCDLSLPLSMETRIWLHPILQADAPANENN